MIPTVLATAKLISTFAAVAPTVPSGPSVADANASISAVSAATGGKQGQADAPSGKPPAKKDKLEVVEGGYFDIGYEKLLGLFSDQIVRGGLRYGQDDLTTYFRNTTLDTRGTGLPYPQAVTGTSIGLEYRHWFPKNQMFATVSIGDGIGGLNAGKTDTRYGLVGYTNWTHKSWFSDVYGELFYVALAGDTFLDARFRGGKILLKDKKDNYYWAYVVGQFWVAGQGTSGTENRFEFGPGIGYVYKKLDLSINLEMRAGYSFRGNITDQLYFNPTLIISTGFDIRR